MAAAVAGFGVALALALVLTPACGHLARVLGVVDRPAPRKLHTVPTPLLGGVAVLVAAAVPILLFARPAVREHVVLLLAGAAAFAVIGFIDDIRDVGAGKLAVEAAVVVAIVWAGRFRIPLPWPYAGEALAALWIVGVANAFNCLDSSDGMAAGTAAVAGLALAGLAALTGRPAVTVAAASVAGAAVGFLRYNFPPARIFLGDAGSLMLGFLLAGTAAVLSGRLDGRLLAAALAVAIPVWDFLLVHWRRYRRGHRNLVALLTSTGKDHLPHRLLAAGMGPQEAVLRVYSGSAALGAAGLAVAVGGPWPALLAAGVLAAGTALGVRGLTGARLWDAGRGRGWHLRSPASAGDKS
jgi:UDP-GlcNAc:undecaprenyl-phosphate GlcNAc-1-phosphate transferase